jgi:hypothetical protein
MVQFGLWQGSNAIRLIEAMRTTARLVALPLGRSRRIAAAGMSVVESSNSAA